MKKFLKLISLVCGAALLFGAASCKEKANSSTEEKSSSTVQAQSDAEISDRLIDTLNTAVSRIAELKAEKEKTEADEAAATAVVEKIDAIGEVTVNSKEAIDSARNAYDALTEDQKAYVSEEKLAVLVAAEIDYTSLEASETSASEGTSVDDSEINAEDGCFAGIGIGSMFALVLLAASAYAAKRRR